MSQISESAQPERPLVCGLPHAEISRAISFARITLIVGLVFIHYVKFPNVDSSLFTGLNTKEHPLATWVGSFVLYFFFSAVPLLSMVSGWLFFSFKPEDARTAIPHRMKRRFISLYMPLVVWNAFFVACLYTFHAFHPDSSFFKEFEFPIPFTRWSDYMNAIFGVTHRPIGFQFWFVRDLFVTALISPLLWIGMKRAPWILGAFLFIGWLRHSHMLIFWRFDVPFFFYLGALVRQKNFNITVPLRVAIGCMVAFVTLAALRALAPCVVDFSVHWQDLSLDIATNLIRLLGVVGGWGLIYRIAQKDWATKICNYGGLAFFLHSAHWPLLAIIKTWLWPLLPSDSDGWMILHYVVCVIITIVIGLGLGRLLAWKVPRFFALMNGGRLLKQTSSRV